MYDYEAREPRPPVDLDQYERVPYPPRADFLLEEMRKYLEGRDLSVRVAGENQWYPTDRWGESRIVIPCTNTAGFPYWQARAMDGNPMRYRSPVFPRVDSLAVVWPHRYGRIDSGDKMVVVEGPLDALAAAGLGHFGIGLMGACPSPEGISHLVSIAKRHAGAVVIVPDLGAEELGPKILAALVQEGVRAEIRLPSKNDLAAMSLKDRKRLLS